jgi:hypothetical protein
MASWNPLVNEIFLRAIEADSAAERAAIVEAYCQADAVLRSKVEALLRAHEQAGMFLEPSESAGLSQVSSADPEPTLAESVTSPVPIGVKAPLR